MDKFEYQAKLEEIGKLIDSGDYSEAVQIADTIDWRRVRSVKTLCAVSELYEEVGRVEDSKAILSRAYRRSPNSRQILYRLSEACVLTQDFDDAVEYYTEYVNLSPNDSNKYVLKYKIYKGRGSSVEEQIKVLEDLKAAEYSEQWAYELASLYEQAGMTQRCVEECDDLALWFHSGKYVVKALKMKQKYAALTPEQQTICDNPSEIVDMETKEEVIEKAVPTLNEEIEKELPSTPTDVIADSILMNTEQEIAAAITEHKEEEKKKEKRYDPANLQAELAHSMRQILSGFKAGHKQTQEEETRAEVSTADEIAEEIAEEAAEEMEETEAVIIPTNFEEVIEKITEETVADAEKMITEAETEEIQEEAAEEEITEWVVEEEITEETVAEEEITEEAVAEEEITGETVAEEEITEEAVAEEVIIEEAVEEDVIEETAEEVIPQETIIEEEAAQADVKKAAPVVTANEMLTAATINLGESIRKEIGEASLREYAAAKAARKAAEEKLTRKIILEEINPDAEAPVLEVPEVPEIKIPKLEVPDIKSVKDIPILRDMPEVEELPEVQEPESEEAVEQPEEEITVPSENELEAAALEEAEAIVEEAEAATEVKVDPMSYTRDGLDEREREMLGFWGMISGVDVQVNEAVTQIMRSALRDKTSSSGNVILVGNAGNGRTTLAIAIAKIVCRCKGLQNAKVAKIYAEDLNNKDIAQVVSKVSGGVLIIEEAGDLSDNTLAQLSMAMDFKTDSLVVFLEDERRFLQELLARNPKFSQKFDVTLTVPVLTNEELVEFGKQYALQKDCSLSDEAVLTLYDGLGMLQTAEQPLAIMDVKEVVDKAIKRSGKFSFGKLFSTLTGKRFDDDNRVIIGANAFKKIKLK